MPNIVPEKRDQLNHVLFLDFDGPLFSDRYIVYHPDNRRPYPGNVAMPDNINYWKMDPLSVDMLNFMHDIFAFTTVVSSSWKRFVNKEQCQDLFEVNGLKLNLADDWATVRMDTFGRRQCCRASEIAEYIDRHGIAEYIILDDPGSGLSLDDHDNHTMEKHRIVMVNPDVGIGSYEHRQMMKIINSWAGIPESPLSRLWG